MTISKVHMLALAVMILLACTTNPKKGSTRPNKGRYPCKDKEDIRRLTDHSQKDEAPGEIKYGQRDPTIGLFFLTRDAGKLLSAPKKSRSRCGKRIKKTGGGSKNTPGKDD